MIFEHLPNLANLSDYLLNFDLYSWTNWSADDYLPDWEFEFEFTPFQLHIFKVFSAILCVIVALIVVFWLRYGEVISERFIRPSEYNGV